MAEIKCHLRNNCIKYTNIGCQKKSWTWVNRTYTIMVQTKKIRTFVFLYILYGFDCISNAGHENVSARSKIKKFK